ncbi:MULTISPECIES: hypothetical protein [Mycobacteriaceae]|uniref:hypothetical protein n=1 Tax=Mycobacteriaceae TaxID=1762 RepID=UPI0007EA368A|nr:MULTISPECIES: hypothetical protein [Mycobacteriaceae]OBF76157.1 hypothetical protein A5751_24805 [Mycolicibacterium fortuitum]TMS51045.1 hypothetical protein E0T84_21035 [Mycobacterium sp. DBP42]
MLSRIAREFAAEISFHDWSDSPYRLDRAGHQRDDENPSKRSEKQLNPEETENVRTNVMWVAAQVLKHLDPNMDLHEFAAACGVPRRVTRRSDGSPSGAITYGIRWTEDGVTAAPPGAPLADLLDRYKSALVGPNYIAVADLTETAVHTAIAEFSKFPRVFKDRAPDAALREYMATAQRYQDVAASVIDLVSVGCRHGRSEHDKALADAITLLGQPWQWTSLAIVDTVHGTPAGTVQMVQTYNERLQSLASLPATLVMYAGVIAAIDGANYGAVRALTTDAQVSMSLVRDERVPAILRLGPWESVPEEADIVALRTNLARGGKMPDDLLRKIAAGPVRHVPFAFSKFLFEALNGRVGRHRYPDLFDEAEMLFSMILADLRLSGGPYADPWLGRFVETIAESPTFEGSPVGRYFDKAVSAGASWAPLRAGMFGGSPVRVAAAVDYLIPEITSAASRRAR